MAYLLLTFLVCDNIDQLSHINWHTYNTHSLTNTHIHRAHTHVGTR